MAANKVTAVHVAAWGLGSLRLQSGAAFEGRAARFFS